MNTSSLMNLTNNKKKGRCLTYPFYYHDRPQPSSTTCMRTICITRELREFKVKAESIWVVVSFFVLFI